MTWSHHARFRYRQRLSKEIPVGLVKEYFSDPKKYTLIRFYPNKREVRQANISGIDVTAIFQKTTLCSIFKGTKPYKITGIEEMIQAQRMQIVSLKKTIEKYKADLES